MISDIVSAVIWGVLFFATFPWIMPAMMESMREHHVGGRRGFRRDFYLGLLPIMPSATALYLALFRTFEGKGDVGLWAVGAAIAAGGIALYWAPPIRAASARLKAAALAAASQTKGG